MSETLERMQERARELARSGKFSGWRSVAFELQFEPGLKEVFQWRHGASAEDAFLWLHSSTAKEELDRLCLDPAPFVPELKTPKPPNVSQTLGRRRPWTGKFFCDNSPKLNRTFAEVKLFIAKQQRLIGTALERDDCQDVAADYAPPGSISSAPAIARGGSRENPR